MKIFTTMALLLAAACVFAQQPAKKIINACGESYAASGVKLKVSVGEPLVGMHSNTSASLSQGFFQSKPAPVVIPAPLTGYSFYPNPFKDGLQIKGDVTKVKQLQVCDAAGRIVLNLAVTGSNINIKGLNAGMYTARLVGENNTVIYFMKLVKL